MRIVMVTPDSRYIDRRILQEAETLFAEGHEIILLAEWQEGLLQYEQIGNIKIERLSNEDIPYAIPEQIIIYLQRKIIGLLNLTSGLFQKIMGLCARIVNKLSHLIILLFQKIKRLRPYEQLMLNRTVYYDPDIIHVHDLPYLRAGVQAKKRLNVPLIYDAHELYPEIQTLSAKDKQQLSRVEKQSLPQCDQVITVNPFIAKEMAQRYQVSQPIVILNAIDPPPQFASREFQDRFRQHFPIPIPHKILLFQGWLSLDRGLGDLVRAMGHVSETIHLVLMGYGEDTKQTLKKIARKEGLTSRVHFKDAVSQAELLFWSSSADAGIIPYQPVDLNHYYCSPNKLFEFIQAGLPIIANDLPFLRQIVAGEGFGVVMPLTSVETYAQAIRLMFDEHGGPGRFKENLLKKAGHYDWSTESVKLLELYSNLNNHRQS